MYQQIEQCFTV